MSMLRKALRYLTTVLVLGLLLLALALLLVLSYFVVPLLHLSLPRPSMPLALGAGVSGLILLLVLPRPLRIWLRPAILRRFQWDGDPKGPGYPRTGKVYWLRWILEGIFTLVVLQYVLNSLKVIGGAIGERFVNGTPLTWENILQGLNQGWILQLMRRSPGTALLLIGMQGLVALAAVLAFLDSRYEKKLTDEHGPGERVARRVPSAVARRVEKAGNALSNVQVMQYLKWKYGDSDTEVLEKCGQVYPVAVFRANHEQRLSPDSVLRALDDVESDDRDMLRDTTYRDTILSKLPGPLDDRPTYALKQLVTGTQVGLTCNLGSYFKALDTCDMLEWEIRSQAEKLRTSDAASFARFERHLPRRMALHQLVPNPVRVGTHRSAAVAISTLVAYSDNGAINLWLRKRSKKGVAVHAGLFHVIPSFMFQPATVFAEQEFSVLHNVYREYLEEIFNRQEPETSEGDWRYFYGDPRLRYLQQLMASGQARLYLTGVCVNLLNLRPEICTLLLITSDEWVRHHGQAEHEDERFHFNPEWASKLEAQENKTPSIGMIRFSPDRTDAEMLAEEPVRPSQMVPPGAAAFWLGVEMLRELLAGVRTP